MIKVFSFVKLHAVDGKPIWVRKESIAAFGQTREAPGRHGNTWLDVATGLEYQVQESVEEVLRLLDVAT